MNRNILLLAVALAFLTATVSAVSTYTNTSGNFSLTFTTEQVLGQKFRASVTNENTTKPIECVTSFLGSDGSVIKTDTTDSLIYGQSAGTVDLGRHTTIDDSFQIQNAYNFTVVCTTINQRASFTANRFEVGQNRPWWSNAAINFNIQGITNGEDSAGVLVAIVFILAFVSFGYLIYQSTQGH